MRIFLSYPRETIILILSISLALCIYALGRGSQDLIETEKTIEELTRTITKYRTQSRDLIHTITTVTVKPDGTREERTEKTEERTKEKSKDTDKSKDTKTVDKKKEVKAALDKYRVSLYKDVSDGSYGVGAGARLGNLPLEAEILGTQNGKVISLGLGVLW